jgi:hypothetical protein
MNKKINNVFSLLVLTLMLIGVSESEFCYVDNVEVMGNKE